MKEQKRHRGYVVGVKLSQGKEEPVWSVRIKDPESEYDGEKLKVLSVHNGCSLGRGLNVTFIVGTIDNSRQQKERRAVDVMPA